MAEKDNKKKPKNLFDFGKDKNQKKNKFNLYWIYGILIVVFLAMNFIDLGGSAKKALRGDVIEMLKSKDVERLVLVNKEKAEIYIKKEELSRSKYEDVKSNGLGSSGPHYYYNITSPEVFDAWFEETQKDIPETDRIYYEPETRRNWGMDILGWILPIALILGVWFLIMRMMSKGGGPGGGGQIFNIGKSKAQLFDKSTSVSIDFKDVAGLEEAKVEIMEIVDFLKKPDKYTKLGGKIPKGAILVGPPGTGKTLLAKAVAGEAHVPFFSISGSDFVEMFVGVGASRVRDLFKQAKAKAPCIIFIDEIDAIGRARSRNQITGANDERENTLNQLLTEMDGFASNAGVIILAATNRADILDRALMRAGRFDRQIHVELPDLKERYAIFHVHIKPLKINNSVDVEFLAKQTPGFSGADIANVCNESALIGARKNRKTIGKQDFMDAIDRIIGGLEKKNKIITAYEKKVIAFHEAGHAAISWLLEYAHPLVKVTIVPRGKALGAAWYLPEERQITTFEQMFDELTAALGGRASEEINFGKVSTGALNDLEQVTKQAFNMVAYFGLNDKIGNISYYDSTGQQEYSFTKPYSEKTAETIDQEVRALVEKAYLRAVEILKKNKDTLKTLAEKLLDKEVIFGDDLEKIFGKRQWSDKREEIIFEPVKKKRSPRKSKKMENSEKSKLSTESTEKKISDVIKPKTSKNQ